MLALRSLRIPPRASAAARLLLVAAGATACGGGGPERPPAPDEEPAPAADDASAEESGTTGGRPARESSTPDATVIDERPYEAPGLGDAGLGALHGEIRITGEPPARFPLGAAEQADCRHHPGVEQLSEVVVAEGGKLRNVYVHLRLPGGFDATKIPAPPSAPVVLDQRACMYTPHVLALQAGQTLHVANSDPTTHNVNYTAPRNALTGNRNMGQGQAPLELLFGRPEEKVRFKCDVHPWMGAWVFVEEHPWFAVSGAEGRFEIPAIPPGTYTVEAIHEHYGKVRGRVVVEAGKSLGIALVFAAD